ncbi:homeodomain-like protein [Tanacetum coccineum]
MDALVDQGSNVNVIPLSIYNRLTNERPAETDIRLSLASHSYIYPLGIAEDVLVDVAGYVYPVDIVILDIKEDRKRPFILGTPFLSTAKAVIRFDKGTITLRSGKSKISFHMIPKTLYMIEKGTKNDIEPIAPTMTVNRYFAFGRHLEELHVTWAHLEKKRTGLQTYTNITQDNVLSSWRQRHQYNVMPSQRRPRQRHWISRRQSIERFLNRFADQPNKTSINNSEFDDGSVDTPFVFPFPHFDNDSDDEEVLNDFDGDDLAFECMMGFRKFTAYLNPLLPMNIISRKAYNTIMVDRLEGTGKNLVAIVRDVYVFVESFTYITDFVVLEGIGEVIMSDMAEVLMGRPFIKTTKLKYDVAKGLVSFTEIFDTYTYRMPRTIPRLKNFNWSKVPPLLELSQNDLMNGLRHPYEKNKFMYKNCLNLGPEYQVNESMKECLIRGHLETASPIQRDAVTTKTKTASLDLTTASEYTTHPII